MQDQNKKIKMIHSKIKFQEDSSFVLELSCVCRWKRTIFVKKDFKNKSIQKKVANIFRSHTFLEHDDFGIPDPTSFYVRTAKIIKDNKVN